MSALNAHVLVVDAPDRIDELVATVRIFAPVRMVHTGERARGAIRSRWLAGLVIAADLEDGSGFSVVEALRAEGSGVPVLVVGATPDPEAMNRCVSLQAFFACRPVGDLALRTFTQRARLLRIGFDQRLATTLANVAAHAGLSADESEVLALSLAGASNKEISARRGTNINTLKSQVRTLLRKLGVSRLDEVRVPILREILLRTR